MLTPSRFAPLILFARLSYGFEDNQTIHMVRGAASRAIPNAAAVAAGSSVPSPASAPSPSTSTPSPSSSSTANPNPLAGNPFVGMGAGGAPDINAMQQQLQSNPEMMRSIMNSPMMSQMMNNPEVREGHGGGRKLELSRTTEPLLALQLSNVLTPLPPPLPAHVVPDPEQPTNAGVNVP